MTSRHLSDEETAIIQRLSPEALRMFFKTFDPGLRIEKEDAEHLRERLLKGPPETLFDQLKTVTVLEAEGICSRQLDEKIARMKQEWQDLKEKESSIASYQDYVSKGQTLLMTVITAGSILAGIVGLNSLQKFEALAEKTDEMRQKHQEQMVETRQELLSGRRNVRDTLQALLRAHAIRIDGTIQDIMENRVAGLYINDETRSDLVKEMEFSQSLSQVLNNTNLAESAGESDTGWKQFDSKLRLSLEFAGALQGLSDENPKPAMLDRQEQIWEAFLRKLEGIVESGSFPQDRDVLTLPKMKAYVNHLLGNVHYSRWREGPEKKPADLQSAFAFFTKAVELDGRFSRAWNNIGVIQTDMALSDRESPASHFEEASDAFRKAEGFHRDRHLKAGTRLNQASLKLLQTLVLDLESNPRKAVEATNAALGTIEQVELGEVGNQLLATKAEAAIMSYLADLRNANKTDLGEMRRTKLELALRNARIAFEECTRENLRNRTDYRLFQEAVRSQILTWEQLEKLLDIKK